MATLFENTKDALKPESDSQEFFIGDVVIHSCYMKLCCIENRCFLYMIINSDNLIIVPFNSIEDVNLDVQPLDCCIKGIQVSNIDGFPRFITKVSSENEIIISLYEKVKELERIEKSLFSFTIRDLLQAVSIIISHKTNETLLPNEYAFISLFSQTISNANKVIIKEMVTKLNLPLNDFEYTTTGYRDVKTIDGYQFLESYKESMAFLDLCMETKRPGLILGD